MQPLNFLHAPPRGPRTQVAGIVFTARVIDKLRAALPGGELNGYFPFTGFSELWAYYTKVDLTALQRRIEAAESEGDVEAWLLERTAELDKAKINAKMEGFDSSRTPESMRDVFEQAYPAALRERYALVFDLLEADDALRYSVP
jgi:uncharacterized protein DUF5069